MNNIIVNILNLAPAPELPPRENKDDVCDDDISDDVCGGDNRRPL